MYILYPDDLLSSVLSIIKSGVLTYLIREFPGNCQGPGSIPDQGTKILKATWQKKKKKKKKRKEYLNIIVGVLIFFRQFFQFLLCFVWGSVFRYIC